MLGPPAVIRLSATIFGSSRLAAVRSSSCTAMADGDRERKRGRMALLSSMAAAGGKELITRRVLVKMMNTMEEKRDVSLKVSEYDLRIARQEAFDTIKHVVTVEFTTGGTFDWVLADPAKLLQAVVTKLPAIATIYEQALSVTPGTELKPWSIVIGFDEFSPGDKLVTAHRRKLMIVNISFLELPGFSLSYESAWLTPIALRSIVMQKVRGGFPYMFGRFLHLLLFGPSGFMSVGAALNVKGTSRLLFARVTNIISDGDGFRMAFNWRGASSMKPCLKCWNTFAKGNADMTSLKPGFVTIACSDHSKFKPTSTAGVAQVVDLVNEAAAQVQAGTLPKPRLDELMLVHGFSPNPKGLLADKLLRTHIDFIEATTLDWVHTELQDGAFSIEAFGIVSVCGSAVGVSQRDFENYLKFGWEFPKSSASKGRDLHRIFDKYREESQEDNQKLKCSASELYGLYILLRHFVETRVDATSDPELALKVESFQASCEVLDIIYKAKCQLLPMKEAARLLKTATASHMEKHLAAYGESEVKPKSHWEMELWHQFMRDPLVLDAFVIERLHLRAKRCARLISNTSAMEYSVLSALTNSILNGEEPTALGTQLVGRTEKFPGFPQARVGDRMQCDGFVISFGDVVFHGEAIGKIVALATEGHDHFAVVDVLPVVAVQSNHSITVEDSGPAAVWRVNRLMIAKAWHVDGHMLTVLHV